MNIACQNMLGRQLIYVPAYVCANVKNEGKKLRKIKSRLTRQKQGLLANAVDTAIITHSLPSYTWV